MTVASPQIVNTTTVLAIVTVCNGIITGSKPITAATISSTTCPSNSTYNASTVVNVPVCTITSIAPTPVFTVTGNITTTTCNQTTIMSNYSTYPASINTTFLITASSV